MDIIGLCSRQQEYAATHSYQVFGGFSCFSTNAWLLSLISLLERGIQTSRVHASHLIRGQPWHNYDMCVFFSPVSRTFHIGCPRLYIVYGVCGVIIKL